jgi:hypothetical protein
MKTPNNMNYPSFVDFHAKKEMLYSVYRDVFTGLTYTTLLGGEFANCHGQGKTEYEAVMSLKIRLNQLRAQNKDR